MRNDLVYDGAEADGEFWGEGNDPNHGAGDCGTFLAVSHFGTFGPDVEGLWRTSGSPFQPTTPFNVVAVAPVSGAGTASDPLTLVTDVKADPPGPALFTLRQTDSYVHGDEHYTTIVTVGNAGPTAHDLVLFRAGDCYLPLPDSSGDSADSGFGFFDAATHVAACTAEPDGTNGHIIGWIPLTPGATAEEGNWDTIWNRVYEGEPFLDGCICEQYVDNGGGISWSFHLGPGHSATFASQTVFGLDGFPAIPEAAAAFTVEDASSCGPRLFRFADASVPAGAFSGWAWTFGDGTGAVGAKAEHVYAHSGTYDVTMAVQGTNGGDVQVSQPVVVVVQPCPPRIDPLGFHLLNPGEALERCALATAGDGGALSFSASGLPQGATLRGSCVSWTPPGEAAGTRHCILLSVVEAPSGLSAHAPCMTIVVRHPKGPVESDADHDAIEDMADNCPGVANQDQADGDADGVGDACQGRPEEGRPLSRERPQPAWETGDRDGDGVRDDADACPEVPDAMQQDMDLDGDGDACDADADGDGVVDGGPAGLLLDNCLATPNPDQSDRDADGVGDACDGVVSVRSLGPPRDGAVDASQPRGDTAGTATMAVAAFSATALGAFVLRRVLRRETTTRRR